MTRTLLAGAIPGLLLLLSGCGEHVEHFVMPEQVTSFDELFEANCAGCHGKEGRDGAARALNDPLFQAVVTAKQLEQVISHGVRGTAMPAFAISSGGELTDQQVRILAEGMQSRWSKPGEFANVALPTYSGSEAGDAQRGQAAYETYCARCHSGPNAPSVLDRNYLALVSDQGLRSNIISGPHSGGPHDWRSYVPSHPMTPQEISDVVAFVASHRGPATQGGNTQP